MRYSSLTGFRGANILLMAGSADPPFIVRGWDEGGFIRTNASFREQVGFSEAELSAAPFVDWLVEDDRASVRTALEDGRRSCHARHRTRAGGCLPLAIQIDKEDRGPIVLGRCVESVHPARPLPKGKDETVAGTLDAIARIVEEQNPGFKCSILLVADGRFVSGAGPSLPDAYNAAIDGYAVGPTVGSCGTAIYWNVPVIVGDIRTDPLWTELAHLAKDAGVAACWSQPFSSKGGRVLGALALYSAEPREPTAEQVSRLRAAARMTGLAVERGRAEEALRQKRKRELELEAQLQQAAKMKALGVLAAGIAHDFNNVLATMVANAELAQLYISPESRARASLTQITNAARRAAEICSQMLSYAGRSALQPSRVEVGTLVSELRDLVHAALSKKATITYELSDGAIFVDGDENQLIQVIMNLVTNAAEAIGDHEGRIVVSTGLEHHDAAALMRLDTNQDLRPGEYVRITVADTGCGMDAETQTRIFDPFYTTKVTGRGLGLSAVRGIVGKHNGLLQLESNVGEGTTFAILLPTVAPVAKQPPPQETTESDQENKRVLVVDDESSLRATLCALLQHEGFDAVEAADGQQAINTFREMPNSFDCVVLDFSMPKLNGEEVFRELRAQRPDVPIILMSGFTEQELLDRFRGANLTKAIQKPFLIDELIASIRAATSE